MNEKLYSGGADRLRAPQRVSLLEVNRVADLALDGATIYNMLDVGTGSGIFAEAFAARGLRVTGIDVNPAMIEAARRHVPDGIFRQGALEDIPFQDNTFDLVFLGHVLHETHVPRQALAEVRRVARLRAVVLEWPYRSEENGPPLDHRLPPAQITALAREAGFDRVEEKPLQHMMLHILS